MSDLERLKATINELAKGAQKTGANLSSFDKGFSQHTQQVQQAMGGSSQRKDKEVVDALRQASSAVKQAVQALQGAAKIASAYGHSL